jgi:hypothetical protein
MLKKSATKKPKVAQNGRATPTKADVKRSIVKVIPMKAKPGPKGTSEKFCLSDVPGSSQSQRDESHRVGETIVERTPCVISFDNLDDDSSLDIREASLPKRVAAVRPSPLPFSHGELQSYTFANLLKILMLVLHMALFTMNLHGMQMEI